LRKRDITIFAVGDKKDYDSFKKFDKEKRFFLKNGFEYISVNYKNLLSGRIPEVKTKRVIVFLFFPFYYWDKYIEHKNYKGIYGNLGFYKKFIRFCGRLDELIKKAFSDKEIFFINNASTNAQYRDKLIIKKKFQEARIPNPKLYSIIHIKKIKNLLNKGENLFLKPRCGSMGKGITFLSWPDWETNFIFKNNKILSKRSDHGWRFRDITGHNVFLRQLLRKDILTESAIDVLILNKKKVDLRVYTFFKKVLFIYPRKNHPDKVTTNITQGGKGDPGLLGVIPKHLLKKAKRVSEKTSRVLGFNLAGIDIALDRNLRDVYVMDVNAFPGFPKRRTFNITQHMLKELKKLLNKGEIHFEKGCNI
jgi:glutathione synthase/RimK-type ligase-like ATP-grasp enzyme